MSLIGYLLVTILAIVLFGVPITIGIYRAKLQANRDRQLQLEETAAKQIKQAETEQKKSDEKKFIDDHMGHSHAA